MLRCAPSAKRVRPAPERPDASTSAFARMKGTRTRDGNRWICSRRRAHSLRSYRSYRDVVRAYISGYREDAAAELEFFRKQSSLSKAIHVAARSIMGNGNRHPHQRRLPASILRTAARRLKAVAPLLQGCRSFAELHDVVRAQIGAIRGIGRLTTYDVATRIGGHLRLEPELVYLHAGTSIGAGALGLDGGETLHPSALPQAFRPLKAREMEDCLCIYASTLARLRSKIAVHRAGASNESPGW